LSLQDIKDRVELLEDAKIRCNTHSVIEDISSPSLGVKDVSGIEGYGV